VEKGEFLYSMIIEKQHIINYGDYKLFSVLINPSDIQEYSESKKYIVIDNNYCDIYGKGIIIQELPEKRKLNYIKALKKCLKKE
jgi:hypothetical protein